VSRFGITLKGTYQDVQITVADAAKFRVLPQPTFDDKGRIKPVKPDPQDPDRRLGGVKGSAEDLRKDVWVVANLTGSHKLPERRGEEEKREELVER
jgi:hypothetical protein